MRFLTVFLLMASICVNAKTIDHLKEGTYKGKTTSKKRVDLYVKKYPGREGSFIAIVVKEDKVGHAYLVDRYNDKKYGMTPLTVLSNAVIGVHNTTPSLSLTIVKEKRKHFIKILNNNSDNKLGFQEGMKIKLKDISKRRKVIFSDTGTYKLDGNRSAATVTAQDRNRESSATFNLDSFNGDFVLREVRPALHLPLKSVMTDTGLSVSDKTNMMAFFLDKKCILNLGKCDFLVLMEADTGKLTYLRKR